MNRKTWRCFHCNEVFRSRKAARNHFGDSYCEQEIPACVDPLRSDEKARISQLRESQRYALECQEAATRAEDRADDLARELDEFRSLTKCRNTHELRMALDSAMGELITARTLIEALRTKAPNVYEEVIDEHH